MGPLQGIYSPFLLDPLNPNIFQLIIHFSLLIWGRSLDTKCTPIDPSRGLISLDSYDAISLLADLDLNKIFISLPIFRENL